VESRVAIWLGAIRPRTLPAAVVPVVVGLGLAARSRRLDVPLALATLAAALLIQIGTNLANDYYDARSGADTSARLGPRRVTQAGLVAPTAVLRAALGVLGAAGLVGIHLVVTGGWPILAIGVASIACAIAYTGGPFPLAYHGLGDAFVFLFFGIVAVNGTQYLQTGTIDRASLLASLPVACLATAILVVNNLRDIPTDGPAGKRTLAVRIGERATRAEWKMLVGAAFLALPVVAGSVGATSLVAVLALPLAVHEGRSLGRRTGAALNESLAGTARLHLAFGLLLAIGCALA
jgi:1,4-dihydroxy-2-naphthoate octaprenyltransferase